MSCPTTRSSRPSSPTRGPTTCFAAGAPLGPFEAFVELRCHARRGGGARRRRRRDRDRRPRACSTPTRLENSPGFFEAFPPFEPGLADELSSGALAYLGLGDPDESIRALLAQATAEAPGLVAGFDDFSKQLAKQDKVNIQHEVLPLLGGEAALGIEPPPSEGDSGGKQGGGENEVEPGPPQGIEPGGPPRRCPPSRAELGFTGVPYLGFVADDVDEEQARKALADLQVPIAERAEPRRERAGAGVRGRGDRGRPGPQPADLPDRQPDLRAVRRQARRRDRSGGRQAGQVGRTTASRTPTASSAPRTASRTSSRRSSTSISAT